MARPCSMEFRERAVARVEAGESRRSVAKALGVSPSAIVKWARRHRERGSVAPDKMGGDRRPKIIGDHAVWLRERIRADDFTLRRLVVELRDRGRDVGVWAVWSFVRAEGLSHKKNRHRRRAG
ncbi:MAG: transposase [Pseudomonadota bacterium]